MNTDPNETAAPAEEQIAGTEEAAVNETASTDKADEGLGGDD